MATSAQQKQRDMEDEEMATEAESDVTIQAERYSYTELKEAQRRCGEKAVAAALQECGTSSTAQQKVFQAHVNDLCASIFIAVVRQYDPDTKEDMEPVDKETVAKLAALEKKLKDKEAAVKELREKVPKLAAEKTRKQLEKSRKRSADVELTRDLRVLTLLFVVTQCSRADFGSVALSERAGAPERDLRKGLTFAVSSSLCSSFHFADLVDDFQCEHQVVRSDQPDDRDRQSGEQKTDGDLPFCASFRKLSTKMLVSPSVALSAGRASYEATKDSDRCGNGAESNQDALPAQRTGTPLVLSGKPEFLSRRDLVFGIDDALFCRAGKSASGHSDAPNASSNVAKQTGAALVCCEECVGVSGA